MAAKLFLLHASHPCATAEKAFQLKGVPYKRVEIPPGAHFAVMRALFDRPRVPAVRFDDGEKVQGSSAIMRVLDRRAPQPRLYTTPEVEEAERWAEQVVQGVARRLMWVAFPRSPRSMHGYQEGQRSPKLPAPALVAVSPVLSAVERRMNEATDEAARADLRALPGHLDRIEELISAGVVGGERPNAADLQLAPSLRLLHTLEDVRPLLAARPAIEELTFRWFDPQPGSVPAGTLPAEWLPEPARVAG